MVYPKGGESGASRRGAKGQAGDGGLGLPSPLDPAGRPGVALDPPPGAPPPGSLDTRQPGIFETRPDLAESIRTLLERGEVKATRRAREGDWRTFTSWCERNGVASLPADVETAAAFLADMVGAGRALATLQRYRVTIGVMHEGRGFPSPTSDKRISELMHRVAVVKGDFSPYAKDAATADVLERMLAAIPGDRLSEVRDRAILLLGAVTGMRRAEISAVDIGDLARHAQGYSILLRRSKTDQLGHGRYVAVPRVGGPRCPVAALELWLERIGKPSEGPLFQSLWKGGRRARGRRLPASQIAEIVHQVAKAAGLDATRYGAHSLRSGYVTQARRGNVSFLEIMAQTGHKKLETVKRYARDPIDPFREGKVEEVARAFAGFKKED